MDDNIEYTDEGLPCFVNKDYVPNDFTGKCYFSMNGYTCYVVNGKLHREDGPAATLDNGQKEWYVNNELHRVGGPAKEFGCGKFYYLYGIRYSVENYWKHPLLIEYQLNRILEL